MRELGVVKLPLPNAHSIGRAVAVPPEVYRRSERTSIVTGPGAEYGLVDIDRCLIRSPQKECGSPIASTFCRVQGKPR